MIKQFQSLLRKWGVDVRRYRPNPPAALPGSATRPVGDMRFLLEDVRSRGFLPRGIIDVGANCGGWTQLALSVFPNTPVIMIEPQAEMAGPLEVLCRENPGVSLVKAGAGSEPGQLVQTIWEDLAGSSFLPEENSALRAQGRQRLTPVVTIDSVVEQRGDFKPDLIKLDIQGFELKALMGAKSVFGRAEMFILEASLFRFMPDQPIARDVIAFMGERGYEIYDVAGILRRPSDGALGQIDLVFVKAAGRLRANHGW